MKSKQIILYMFKYEFIHKSWDTFWVCEFSYLLLFINFESYMKCVTAIVNLKAISVFQKLPSTSGIVINCYIYIYIFVCEMCILT